MLRFRKKKSSTALVDGIWQDRDVQFDVDLRSLRLINGERVIERIENVEDVKGNKGDRGVLRVTNLRLIWHTVANLRTNLSIGYKGISGITTKVARSKLRGQTDCLYVMARAHSTTNFEFIFTCNNPTNTTLFMTVIGIHRAYETSSLYRDMKLRSAFINDDETVKLLPSEYQCERFDGVWNLSNDQGNLGVFILTNIRIIWYESFNLMYNVSIPFMQLRNSRIRDSRFGRALVLETSQQSGEYVLGFRIEPAERLEAVCRSVLAVHNSFLSAPIFGVHIVKEQTSFALKHPSDNCDEFDKIESEIEEDNKAQRIDAFAAYFMDGAPKNDGEQEDSSENIVYSEELGVAIQRLKPGFTISDLWNINVE